MLRHASMVYGPPMNLNDELISLQNWLLSHGPGCRDLAHFLRLFNNEILSNYIPVDRIFVGSLILHPLSSGIAVSYDAEEDRIERTEISHERFALLHSDVSTPMAHMVSEKQRLRARLATNETHGMQELQDLAQDGYTDYLAMPIVVGGRLRAGLTFATRYTDGFSEDTIELLQRLMVPMGPVLILLIQNFEHRSILKAYLGADAGERVWSGQIHRGDSEALEAAICFCDLRGFTELSEQLARDDLLHLINDVFAQLVACVSAQGGQVLKFMGDGMLATFANTRGRPLCEPALEAAKNAIDAIETLRDVRKREHKVTPKIGIGLHVGEVLYGNIGAPGRLDFTVIGSAVNQTARIEGLCSRVGQEILMSEAFAHAVDATDHPQGEYTVKGFDEAIRIYGLTPRLPISEPQS